MHVIVVGCGRVGSELATRLDQAGHKVVVIDKEAASFKRLSDTYGGRTVVGFGFDRDTLAEAEVEHADALAAVTSGDNSNILTARIARENFEIEHVVARIYDPRRALIYQRLGIQTVATVTWTTDQVMRRLSPEDYTEEWSTPNGELVLTEVLLPDNWAGKRLSGIESQGEIRIVAISRAEKSTIPTHDSVGQEGDLLHVAVKRNNLAKLECVADLTIDEYPFKDLFGFGCN